MKILNSLTIKHLKMNKKRTIVTIIGIMLSMALMLGFGLLLSSFLDTMKKETIDYSGSYNALFPNITYDEASKISKNVNVKTSYSYSSIGFASLNQTENSSKPYLFLAESSKDLLERQKLVEGRFPENNQEVVISEHILYNGGVEYKIGDILNLDVGPRVINKEKVYENVEYNNSGDSIEVLEHKSYKIVGIMKRSIMEDFSSAGYTILTLNNEFNKIKPNFLYVEYKNVAKTYDYTEKIQNDLKINSDIQYNSSLLYYYGTTRYSNINQSIMMVLGIVLSLLSVGCIIVIYNSFAISTMERKKQFGLYSSIGATRKQIMHTVFFEALLVGSIGIILGILSSFLGIYIVLQILNYLLASIWSYHFVLVLSPVYIIIPIIFMVFVVYFSALIPAKRSSRVTPIEAIRENDDIKMPKRKLKTGVWVQKLFGIEGELALKNMKRNKKKYRITILSLFVSIVLFISFSTYLTYGLETSNSFDTTNYDIGVFSQQDGLKTPLKDLTKESSIDSYHLYGTASMSITIPDEKYFTDQYNNYLKQTYGNSETDKNSTLGLAVTILEDEEFSNYTNSIGKKKDDILFLNSASFTIYTNDKRLNFDSSIFKNEIPELKWCIPNNANDKDDCSLGLDNLVKTDKLPEGLEFLKYEYYMNILISESHYTSLLNQVLLKNNQYKGGNIFYNLLVNSESYKELYDTWSTNLKNKPFTVTSPKIDFQNNKNFILAIKILLYGFISLITLIGVTSVFNTIHTSINLRRKEFAMLRSMGLTPKGFNRMILFESLFFGFKSLLYALPVSVIFIVMIHLSMSGFITREQILVPWGSVIVAIVGVFLIVLLSMIYSVRKIKKENILDAIRDENI